MEDLRIARRSSVIKVQANCIFKSTKNELLMQTLEGARKEMGLSDNDDKPLKQNMFKVV